MHFANHFAYLISYHLLRNTLPSELKENESSQNSRDHVWTDCPFVPPGFEIFPHQSMETQLWHIGLKTWDPETVVAHQVYRKYIGLANRIFGIFQIRKLYNMHHLNDVESNVWYSPRIRSIVLALYYKTYRIRAAINRFIRIWRTKRAIVQVSTDLYMTPLDPACKRTFKLLQEGRIYMFSLQDLTNLVVSAITHHSIISGYTGLYHNPKPVKNPYTNNPLTKSDLCNIYFRMRKVYIHVPDMIRRFFLCEFNIYRFSKDNRAELERIGVCAICKNMPKSSLYNTATVMLSQYATHLPRGSTVRFNYRRVHPDFPKDVLVNKLRSYIELYFLAQYSVNGIYEYEPLLKRRIDELFKYNPLFGQAIYRKCDDDPNKKTIFGFYDWTPRISRSFMYYLDTHRYVDETNNRFSFMGDVDATYFIDQYPEYEEPEPINTQTQNPNPNRTQNPHRTLNQSQNESESESEQGLTIVDSEDESIFEEEFEEEFDDTFDD